VKTAYFDCFAGAAGDMILGALVDAGLAPDVLRSELAKLGLTHFALDLQPVQSRGIAGTRVLVRVDQDHHRQHPRRLADIERIITGGALEAEIQRRSLAVFRRLAEAEAGVHGTSLDEVHFHEVGAVDTIIDVVGAVIGLKALGIKRVCCSPLPLGSGTVRCAHGLLPVPAPATVRLLQGVPVYSQGIAGELVTPTGAAILTECAAQFGPLPPMVLETVGYGAGSRELEIPNLLRVLIGECEAAAADTQIEQVAVIETEIDDMNPQIFGHLMDELLARGVLDVFFTPAQMKKNRPGTLLTVLCRPHQIGEISDFILRETSTIGLRWRLDQRLTAARRIERVPTRFGPLAVKVARAGGRIINIQPEYGDCRRAALAARVPLKEVLAAVGEKAGKENIEYRMSNVEVTKKKQDKENNVMVKDEWDRNRKDDEQR